MVEIKPTRPVPRGCAQGFFGGRYKVEPEDFVVDELPAYEPSGTGEHLWLLVEKRGLSTLDLLDRLSGSLDVDPRAFGVAGLKDARAVATQWVSVQGVPDAAVEGLGDERWRVVRASRHGNKLKTGHLRGNRFAITLRGTAPEDLAKAKANLAELERVGVPNYFGEQRFGKRGANLAKGLAIVRGRRGGGAGPGGARRLPRRVLGLVLSAVQSEVFNRVVAARLRALGTLLPGDLAFLHEKGAVFPVRDAAAATAEQPRADAFELSPSGPMPGPKMPQPDGEPKAIEDAALAVLELRAEDFVGLPYGLASGERRPLRMPVRDASAEAVDHGLRLSFTLPRGGYATSVLRELLTEAIWFSD